VQNTVFILSVIKNSMNLQQFKFYELLERGTFGKIHRALNKETGEVVSIKCISTHHLQQDLQNVDFPFDWIAEVGTKIKFSQPHIMKFFGNFQQVLYCDGVC
jgi:serine/threonine protein kinase